MKSAITGTVSSGKSHARRCLEKLGANTLDADALVHRLYNPYDPKNSDLYLGDTLYKRIIEEYGDIAIDHSDSYKKINRPKLREIVMQDPKKMKYLADLTAPYIKTELTHTLQDGIYVEVPLLFEGGWQNMFDRNILIAIENETRIERLMARNNIERDAAEKWIATQMLQEEKIKLADLIIWNDDPIPKGKEFTEEDPLFVKMRDLYLADRK